jgi:GTP pyrophosphokinase
MHEQAERGVAAAWAYADAKRHGSTLLPDVSGNHDVAWVQQLATWQQEVDSPEEFFQTLRTDFFRNRIFCLTPAGEVVNLPEGATPVDFAYAVHSQIGHRGTGAKVNGAIRPLDYHLASGDLVEIVTDSTDHPRREWLDFVKTTTARKAITQWYRRLDDERSRTVGRDLLARELRELVGREYSTLKEEEFGRYMQEFGYRNVVALEVAVGRGERNPRQVIKRMFAEEILPTDTTGGRRLELNVKVAGAVPRGGLVRAQCCRPIEGDRIVALTSDGKVQVHRDECRRVGGRPDLIAAAWIIEPYRTYRLWLKVQLKTYTGMLRDVADVCAQQRIGIHDISVRRRDGGQSSISLLVELGNTEQLSLLMRKLRSLPEVVEVARGRS